MKIKLELNGNKYEGNIEKVSSDTWSVYKTIVDNQTYYWMLPGDKMWRMFTSTEQMKSYGYNPEGIDLLAPPDFFRQYLISGPISGVGIIPPFFYEWPWQGEPNCEPICKAWRPGGRGIISIGTGEGSMPSPTNAKTLCNLWLPFATYEGFMEGIGRVGVEAIFMHTIRDEKRFNVGGYLAVEEPLSKPSTKPIGNRDDGKVTDKTDTIWGRINTFRRKTSKPIGILDNDVHFRIDSAEYERHLELYLAVDFLMSELYPYHTEVDDPIERMKQSYRWLSEFSQKHNKPFIIVAQATYGEANGKLNYPNLASQYNFWVKEKGLGIVWWKWQGSSGYSIKEEFQEELKRLHNL